MRIQHNIMAMNAYRNYTNNVSAMKSNLEKLSSGYKINRAGDDAAGLAISEKMRAQITGLETAQKNAKDGISLVQTAEGAMTEVHDMLNRMVELATQSANGTYDVTTDRAQMQKEMDQLNDEINRIADSANFNGIKLLDGSMDSTVTETINETTFAGEQTGLYVPMHDNGTADDDTDDYALINGAVGNKQGWGLYTHKDATGAGKTSFEARLSNYGMEGLKAGEAVTITFGLRTEHETDATAISGLKNKIEVTVNANEDGKVTGEMIAKALAEKNDGKVTLTNKSGIAVEYNVTRKGDSVSFEMSDAGYETAKGVYEDSPYSAKNWVFDGNYNIDIEATVERTPEYADADTAAASGLYYKDANGTAAAAGDFTAAAKVYDKNGSEFTVALDGGKVTLTGNAKVGDGWTDNSTSVTKMGTAAAGTQLADGLVGPMEGWNLAHFKDGSGIKLGDTAYVFALTDDTAKAKYDANTKVIDLRDLVDPATGKLANSTNVTKALHRVVDAAGDNKMWSVQLSNTAGYLAIREREDYNGNGEGGRADLTTREGIEKQVQMFTKANASSTVKEATGKSLTLQIGDTADSYNQLKVNIADMHAAALGLDKISIANQEDAAKAVDVIKAAINTVSDVRGTLGATQNRLDHTINNLSVMTENIQDAESTIRDVDVAEEMMAYTKNNILIQSAQAMLAQANQVPQGVLQLLG